MEGSPKVRCMLAPVPKIRFYSGYVARGLSTKGRYNQLAADNKIPKKLWREGGGHAIAACRAL